MMLGTSNQALSQLSIIWSEFDDKDNEIVEDHTTETRSRMKYEYNLEDADVYEHVNSGFTVFGSIKNRYDGKTKFLLTKISCFHMFTLEKLRKITMNINSKKLEQKKMKCELKVGIELTTCDLLEIVETGMVLDSDAVGDPPTFVDVVISSCKNFAVVVQTVLLLHSCNTEAIVADR
ncbi:hypothetical protein GJ496_005540 [Pomphorhynchus laevis]|nr:hypothetical protein GJ496_005540 [Pomphorhynchus laevis]